jgi:type IV pilus assembly protein PilA
MSNINLKGWDLMKIMKKKKGFTLIELMIVLAIIAILAVVLIPKATVFKNSAKASGVLTNVNTVQAYLETKTGSNFAIPVNSQTGATVLQGWMTSNFNDTGTNNSTQIVNPFYPNVATAAVIANSSATAGSASVVVVDSAGSITTTTSGSTSISSTNTTGFTNYAGEVIVVVNQPSGSVGGSYNIYGIDGSGNVIKSVIVNQ